MNNGETIVFQLPKAEVRTGKVVGEYDGMPEVVDHNDSTYPVHPGNITDVGNEKWSAEA